MQDVTVIILTRDEEMHIGRAIASVKGFARDILVVDSGSTDRTVEIAQGLGARVLVHPFFNYARQFNWALDNGGVSTESVLRLDADEVIEDDLAREISARLPTLPTSVVGVNFWRKHVFMGRWIRHGDRYPLVLLRLWRFAHGRIENTWMDEHVVTSGGELTTFRGGFADRCERDLTFFTAKHNSYSVREAISMLSARYGLAAGDDSTAHARLSGEGASRQAVFKRWAKRKIFDRLPMWCGPLAYFLYRYILRLGFLDGREGLIYHVLQGFWYRFLVAAKVDEYDRELRKLPSVEEKRARLAQLTGYDLSPQ